MASGGCHFNKFAISLKATVMIAKIVFPKYF